MVKQIYELAREPDETVARVFFQTWSLVDPEEFFTTPPIKNFDDRRSAVAHGRDGPMEEEAADPQTVTQIWTDLAERDPEIQSILGPSTTAMTQVMEALHKHAHQLI